MGAEFLTIEGCTLDAGTGVVTILPSPISILSTKVKCDGKRAYHIISFTVQDGTYSGGGMIVGTSDKVKSLGSSLVKENDAVDVTLVNASPPYDSKTVNVKVSAAGQTDVKVI